MGKHKSAGCSQHRVVSPPSPPLKGSETVGRGWPPGFKPQRHHPSAEQPRSGGSASLWEEAVIVSTSEASQVTGADLHKACAVVPARVKSTPAADAPHGPFHGPLRLKWGHSQTGTRPMTWRYSKFSVKGAPPTPLSIPLSVKTLTLLLGNREGSATFLLCHLRQGHHPTPSCFLICNCTCYEWTLPHLPTPRVARRTAPPDPVLWAQREPSSAGMPLPLGKAGGGWGQKPVQRHLLTPADHGGSSTLGTGAQTQQMAGSRVVAGDGFLLVWAGSGSGSLPGGSTWGVGAV